MLSNATTQPNVILIMTDDQGYGDLSCHGHLFEMLKAGERGITMARAYNYREGFTGEDDSLPERMFEPMREGT